METVNKLRSESKIMRNLEVETRAYLYKRFNDFRTNKDYEAAASFLFNVQKGAITVSIDLDVLKYICDNFDDLYMAMINCKY